VEVFSKMLYILPGCLLFTGHSRVVKWSSCQ